MCCLTIQNSRQEMITPLRSNVTRGKNKKINKAYASY